MKTILLIAELIGALQLIIQIVFSILKHFVFYTWVDTYNVVVFTAKGYYIGRRLSRKGYSKKEVIEITTRYINTKQSK